MSFNIAFLLLFAVFLPLLRADYVDEKTCNSPGGCSVDTYSNKSSLYTSACGENQRYGCSSCRLTCDDLDISADQKCSNDCPHSDHTCICDPTYRWNNKIGKCVPLRSCPRYCRPHATFYEEGPIYPDRCPWPEIKNNIPKFRLSPQIKARNVCVCDKGYLLNYNHDCVLPEDCPEELHCPEDQQPAITNCPRTCQSIQERGFRCVEDDYATNKTQKCLCKPGLALDTSKGQCVPYRNCPLDQPSTTTTTTEQPHLELSGELMDYGDKSMDDLLLENEIEHNSAIAKSPVKPKVKFLINRSLLKKKSYVSVNKRTLMEVIKRLGSFVKDHRSDGESEKENMIAKD